MSMASKLRGGVYRDWKRGGYLLGRCLAMQGLGHDLGMFGQATNAVKLLYA